MSTFSFGQIQKNVRRHLEEEMHRGKKMGIVHVVDTCGSLFGTILFGIIGIGIDSLHKFCVIVK